MNFSIPDYQIRMDPGADFRRGARLKMYGADRGEAEVHYVGGRHNVLVVRVEPLFLGEGYFQPAEMRVLQLVEPHSWNRRRPLEDITWSVVELCSWPAVGPPLGAAIDREAERMARP